MSHPEKPTVVLLHSSGSSSRQWASLAAMLEPRYRVRAVDLHGHGRQAPWRENEAFALADDTSLAASHLDAVDGAHVVGHSYGAAVALKLASMHPRRVRSVVAYEPVMLRWLLDDDRGRRLARDIAAVAARLRRRLWLGDEDAAARQFIDFWSGGGAWDAMAADRRQAIAARMGAVTLQFDALFDEPLRAAQLARLRIPMLFLSGAESPAIALHLSGLLRAGIPGADHETMPGMGHMGPITHATEVNRRIAGFFRARDHAGCSPSPPRRWPPRGPVPQRGPRPRP